MKKVLIKLLSFCLLLLWLGFVKNVMGIPLLPIFIMLIVSITLALKAKKDRNTSRLKNNKLPLTSPKKINNNEKTNYLARLLFVLNKIVEIKINDLESDIINYDYDLDDQFDEYYEPALIKVPTTSDSERLLKSIEPIKIPDEIKPASRLEYEAMAKDAVPKFVYANAYTSRKCDWFPSNYIVIDTETTGLEPSYQRIIEIGAIKYINHEPVDKFHMLINPERNYDDYIVDLTGIKKEQLKYAPTIKETLPKFYSFIEDYVLIAHNAPFDIKILACEAYRVKIPLFRNRVIDTLTLSKRCIPKEKIANYKLETIKDYLGLEYKSHRALDDCETCSAIYQLYCSSLDRRIK